MSERYFDIILREIPTAIVVVDAVAQKITYANEKAIRLYGFNPQGVEAAQVIEKITQSNLEGKEYAFGETPIARALLKGENVQKEILLFKRKNEIPLTVAVSANPIKDPAGNITAAVAIIEDITEPKTAEDALRESEERFRVMADGTPSMLWVSDANGKSIFVNKYYEEYFAVTFEQAKEQWQPLVHPEDAPLYVEKFLEALHEHKPFSAQARVKRGDGEWRWIESNAAPRFSADNEFLGHVGISIDITERKKAEEALRESEQRLRFHAENIPLAVVEWDRNFVVTRWAGDAEKMFGWTASETTGKPIMDLQIIYEPDVPIVEKTMGRLTSGETKVVSSNRNITKDGRVIYCTWYNSVLLDDNGKMISVFSFVEDNTPRVKAEESLEENNRNLERLVEERTKQLKDSERLATIGATAGMVGHDIRNPLQAITSDVFLAKTELISVPDSEEKKNTLESLEEIEKNTDYINKIVQDLQDYARPLNPQAEEADIKLIIENLTKNIPEKIKVSVKVEDVAKKISADSYYINRIMYNLVTNSVQAMPKGGKLTIQAYKEANDVVITVKDTGVGIPKEVQEKMFTPMFTTKSKGQGFGLPVVKRMTEALGGTVSFESQEGKGTTFTVRLPSQSAKC